MSTMLNRGLMIWLPLMASLLAAQDAGLVLRTYVSYRTAEASATLTPEQRAEADKLGKLAQQASSAGKYGEALRNYYHGFAVIQGVPWTPGLEMASSLQAKADHALTPPGRSVQITLAPLYTVEGTGKLYAAVLLHPMQTEAGTDRVLVTTQALAGEQLPVTLGVPIPAAVSGNYQLVVRLAESEAGLSQRWASAAVKTLPIHVEALSAEAEQLRKRLESVKTQPTTAALATAEYALRLYDQADRGETNPHQYDYRREFANANSLLDAVTAGRDPFAAQRGDVRRAYRSSVDGSLQPYRLFIPENFDKTKTMPLVVALHGMGGDENSLFDQYGAGALKREAAKHDFLVVCPKGRDPASMYRGAAEQDVLDVLAEVRRAYPVDPDRIYLMGHSMGAYGTWSIALDHPDLFAALGPVSGGGNAAAIAKIKNVPEYVVHGDADKTVAVSESRKMVEAGRQAGMKVEYVEVPGGSHTNVVVPQFGPMLDFFAHQKRQHAGE